jgi:pyruvate dehydrogenase E1 component alpha subunit
MARRSAASAVAGKPPAQEDYRSIIPVAELKTIYRQMLVARRFEEKCAQSYTQAKIGGYCHLYIGQEAVAGGFLPLLRPNWDYVVTGYRDHVQPLFMGTPPGPVMAELYGKVTGTSGGKGGSMHLYDVPRGFMGGWGIVGGQVPLGIGFAFAAKYRGEDRVTLASLGDGATPIGAFHESMNLAGILDLPIVIIIENNRWAMGTGLQYTNASEELHRYGEGYGIEHRSVDGMDLWKVRAVAEEVIAKARAGKPQLVEALTYRFRGHSMADAGQYRTKEEVNQWRERDPLEQVARYLEEIGAVTGDDLEEMNEAVRKEVQEAVDFAEASPFPPAENLYSNVYVGGQH